MALAIYGTGITRGTAIGRVHIARRNHFDVAEQSIPKDAIEAEVHRFRQAVRQARNELATIRDRVAGTVPADIVEFIDTHGLMLEDSSLTEAPVQVIRERSCTAEWALQVQRNQLAAVFDGMEDPYLASRVDDVDQCVSRILRILAEGASSNNEEGDSRSLDGLIVVADDMAPADLTMMHHGGIAGLVTEHGGPLSHTAILARSLKIPTAMGVHRARTLLKEGERIIIDGDRGIVIAHPPRSVQQHYAVRLKQAESRRKRLHRNRHKPAISRDGETVLLQANVDIPGDLELLKDSGADGIGMYRSEYLFMNRSAPPDEEEQFEAYRRVIESMRGKPVTLRTARVHQRTASNTDSHAVQLPGIVQGPWTGSGSGPRVASRGTNAGRLHSTGRHDRSTGCGSRSPDLRQAPGFPVHRHQRPDPVHPRHRSYR
jgi:phosphotransferase system enzyme I (PtsI)